MVKPSDEESLKVKKTTESSVYLMENIAYKHANEF